MSRNFFLVLIFFIGTLVIVTLYRANVFKRFEFKNSNLICEESTAVKRAEDLEYLEDGFLAASTDLRLISKEKREAGDLIYLSKTGEVLAKLSDILPFKIFPHGIDVLALEGKSRIFAINHRTSGDTVEVIDFINGEFVFQKSIKAPEFVNLNDIEAISADSFFVSRDHLSREDNLKLLENFSQLGLASVYLVENEKVSKLEGGYIFANGLAYHRKSQQLFVAEMIKKRIRVYAKDQSGKMKIMKNIYLEVFPDNLNFDLQEKNLWIGAHGKILRLKDHAKSPTTTNSSSFIYRLQLENFQINLEYSDSGKNISGASVALPFQDDIWLGTIYQNHLYRCWRKN